MVLYLSFFVDTFVVLYTGPSKSHYENRVELIAAKMVDHFFACDGIRYDVTDENNPGMSHTVSFSLPRQSGWISLLNKSNA